MGGICRSKAHLYDEPELVQQGLAQARAMYQPIYENLYAAGGMSKETGTVGWFPMWCEGKTAAVQCDLSVFIGNDLVQRIENKLAKSSIYSKG